MVSDKDTMSCKSESNLRSVEEDHVRDRGVLQNIIADLWTFVNVRK
jgi:hypothetical protein